MASGIELAADCKAVILCWMFNGNLLNLPSIRMSKFLDILSLIKL